MKSLFLFNVIIHTFYLTSVLALPLNQARRSTSPDFNACIINDAKTFAETNFTHLVIGGGTAGLAVATRLSEIQTNLVGVIEAGSKGFDDPINLIPGRFGANLKTQYDWNYTTSSSGQDRSIAWPRGHVLGGSSVLNFLVWDRASKAEYDAWEEMGNEGWNWQMMDKYMRKAEMFTSTQNTIQGDNTQLGDKGPVKISLPQYISNQVKYWIPALQSIGLKENSAPLSGDNLGVSIQPSDIDPTLQIRQSSPVAYLQSNKHRSNLKILVSTVADKIVLEKSTSDPTLLTAHGATFSSGGHTYTVRASEEVIVSGGSVNTPKLLELSGIGNIKVLQAAGVKQLIDLPGVGENLQDHTYTSVAYELKEGQVTLDTLRFNTTFSTEQEKLRAAGKPSILGTAVPAIGYLTLPQLIPDTGKLASIIQSARTFVAATTYPFKKTLVKQLEYLTQHLDVSAQMEVVGINGFYSTTGTPGQRKAYMTLLAAQQHLLSRGSIHITSSDPSLSPSIRPNYFHAPFDLDVSTFGTQYLRKIGNSPAYSDAFVKSEAIPGLQADIHEYTRTTFASEYHPIGTTSMLPRKDGGVVDTKLKVYGTSNLRVVDASIIPLHLSAHIQATVYGIAEYAADIIKEEACP
ncbi:alcohol oxidase [Meira miltonrushii]|uniref:Alcohol oxidase n=1 Tax=Meira miltonrushii TaxID=1280837 RepID=A0A316VML9_9BASI|nr:alcohol oxidase [Meira miltonrushii]PWN38534.1 alcohol oxidase [Meira miltonrushii]